MFLKTSQAGHKYNCDTTSQKSKNNIDIKNYIVGADPSISQRWRCSTLYQTPGGPYRVTR